MNPTTRPPDEVFLAAARCADCPNPACVQACPEHIDLQALFEFIAEQMPVNLARMRQSAEAASYAGQAIHNSFE